MVGSKEQHFWPVDSRAFGTLPTRDPRSYLIESSQGATRSEDICGSIGHGCSCRSIWLGGFLKY
jgi:hypothetical protein